MLIYAIGVFGGGSTPEEAGGPGLLSHIAEQTGGRMFYANSGGVAGRSQEDRHRTPQPLHPGLLAREPGARREIPSRGGKSGAAARTTETASSLARRLQRARSIGGGGP